MRRNENIYKFTIWNSANVSILFHNINFHLWCHGENSICYRNEAKKRRYDEKLTVDVDIDNFFESSSDTIARLTHVISFVSICRKVNRQRAVFQLNRFEFFWWFSFCVFAFDFHFAWSNLMTEKGKWEKRKKKKTTQRISWKRRYA